MSSPTPPQYRGISRVLDQYTCLVPRGRGDIMRLRNKPGVVLQIKLEKRQLNGKY